ncbi:AF4/FMR2 family member 3 isoform X3 [Trichoplusia ni]|uniref:AF4/FMR2 family member lilli n=1 Tax=Trichoplusia ni TaxID=7111 RepID=A0A7E5W6Q8_TRINI|nr:AF4/FMR2 family member 3 isoform X3 [Trichoplusia ni]
MHLCYERPGLVTSLNGGVGYDKWDRDRGGGSGGGATGAWAGRDRERDRERERERQARAHQMSQAHAAEPDASSLFPAPFRVTGNRDRVSQQIQTKLGDYHLAQCFIDDPSKSIGICAEPPSPAPCPPSRRESEFKKPAHAPQNGVRHHRPHVPHNKSDGSGTTGAPHRPPPIRIPNGIQSQNAIDSSQPPIESILKEMKLPTPLSVIAATPRKELENKFIFNPYTNKVQENPQLAANDLKTPLPKPGLDNRISNSRSSVSPDVVNKDLGLSESDDEVANTHVIGPPLSPIGSGSPSSGSSSQSEDSESESSSAGSTTPAPAPTAAAAVTAPAAAPPPAQRSSWSLSNFAPPPAHPPDQTYDSGKDVRHALADIKGKPSPISEMSDSDASSPSPDLGRRRRSIPNRVSAASSDEDTPRHTTSPRVAPSAPTAAVKRGRPPKARPSEERPVKKRRGRPPKPRVPTPPPSAALHMQPAAPADSDVEPDPPAHHHPLQDTKTHIFRKVFTPKKSDECGGKGGKGGKGKGGKGKGQVTIIEVTAPEADEEERRHRERSAERRNEEALARLSPPREPDPRRREPERLSVERPERAERHDRRRSAERLDRPANDRIPIERPPSDRTMDRIPERTSYERIPSDRIVNDRIPTERTSNDRIQVERPVDRISTERTSTDRTASDRSSSASDRLSDDRLSRGLSSDRLADRRSSERLPNDKVSIDRLSGERMSHDRLSGERTHERIAGEKMSHDRLPDTKGRLSEGKMSIDRLEGKVSLDKPLDRIPTERYIRAEADVGSGLKSGRGSERLEEASSNVAERRRSRVVVRVALSRLRPETLRALQRPTGRTAPKRPHTPHPEQGGEVAATNHERTDPYAGQTPIYFSYFERLPADALSDEERDHKYYLEEATRLRTAAEREQEPLPRVMLYLESVLCFVLTGRVLELELDTKGAFTIYRETIEYIKSIHSMPQRFRASPHDTFNKLDILSLRVQALLYLRMFKMYNREVKEYNKIVHEYQQKPALAESVSPLSPTPSPAGSVGSVGSGSASSGYCSLAHSVPAHAHQALLLLNKYYAFLYVAHDLWEQADSLCRLRANRDLFIAVDRKCGPLSLSSTFRHLVQYVRHAISLLKNAPRE